MKTYSVDYGSRVLKVSVQVKKRANDIIFPQSDEVKTISKTTFMNGLSYQEREYKCGKNDNLIKYQKDKQPLIYCRDSLLHNKLITLPALSNYSQEVQDECQKEDFISANMFLFSQIASQLNMTEEDHLNIVIPPTFTHFQRYCLMKACELANIKNTHLVPDCIAASLEHGHYPLITNVYQDKPCKSMFINFGASGITYYIVKYVDKSIEVLEYGSDENVTGYVIEDAIKDAIIQQIEEDKEEIEDCDATVEEVKSAFNFLDRENREGIEDLKRELEDDEDKELNIEWEYEKEDYEGDYDILSKVIIEKIKPVLKHIDAIVEKAYEYEVDEIEVFGSVSYCMIYKNYLKECVKNHDKEKVIPLKETMVSLTSLSNGGAIACACDKSNPDFSSEALVDASMPSLSSLNIQFVTKDSSSSKNSEFVTFKQKREDLVKKNEKISFSYSKPIVEKKIACVRSQPITVFEDDKVIAIILIEKRESNEIPSSPVIPDSLISVCISLDANHLLQCRVESEEGYDVRVYPIHNGNDKWWSLAEDIFKINESIQDQNIQSFIDDCNSERTEMKEKGMVSRYLIAGKEYARFRLICKQIISIQTTMSMEFDGITNISGFEVFKKPYALFRKAENMEDLQNIRNVLNDINPSESQLIQFKEVMSKNVEEMEKIINDYIYHRVR